MSAAISRISSGGPSAEREEEPGPPETAPGWPGNAPRWGGQCCPPSRAEKPRKCAGLRESGTPAFGEEAERLRIIVFGSLMSMVVTLRSMKQFGNEPPEKVRQVHVEVPEERQHQANNHELKEKLRATGERVHERDEEQHADDE